jgi:hypothetical protein
MKGNNIVGAPNNADSVLALLGLPKAALFLRLPEIRRRNKESKTSF